MWYWSLKSFVLETVKQWEERKNCILMLRLILKTEPRIYDDKTMWPLYRSSYLYINIQIQVPGSSMHQVWTRSLGDTWPGPVLLRERHIEWTLTIMIRATWESSLDLVLPVVQKVKSWPVVQETRVCSLGQEDPLEKEMATHCSSCLKNPKDRRAWRTIAHGVAMSWTDWANNTFILSL